VLPIPISSPERGEHSSQESGTTKSPAAGWENDSSKVRGGSLIDGRIKAEKLATIPAAKEKALARSHQNESYKARKALSDAWSGGEKGEKQRKLNTPHEEYVAAAKTISQEGIEQIRKPGESSSTPPK